MSTSRGLKSAPLARMLRRMIWHVQYMISSGEAVEFFPTPERAIEAACGLIDAGLDVFGIGAGPLTDSITKAEIEKIYNLRLPAPKPAL